MCPSMIISASAGMMTGWETAFVTASGRLANPPAMAISFACSGIRDPIAAAVYCSADSKRARQFMLKSSMIEAMRRINDMH